jgi:hypothetical protein
VKHSLACGRCGQRRIWNLRRVLEHSAGGPKQLGSLQGLSPMEAFICDACSYTEWYSAEPALLRAYPELAIVDVHDDRLRCVHCDGRDNLLIARFQEAPDRMLEVPLPLAVLRARGVAKGTFAVIACRGCGLFRWFACEFPRDTSPQGEVARPCARCGDQPLQLVPSVLEMSEVKLPLIWASDGPRGHFRLEVCTACGFTDWFAEGTRGLQADGVHTYFLVGHKPVPPRKRDNGPYR